MLVLKCGAAQAQPQQGLMSRLIEIKYSTELYLSTQIKNETNSAKKDSALALYNTMRWKMDGFIGGQVKYLYLIGKIKLGTLL
jgi:hypothetical protein